MATVRSNALCAAWIAVLCSAAGLATMGPARAESAAVSAATIQIVSLDWEPYVGEQLPEQGYVAALIRAAYAQQGRSVSIEFYPWARALELARSGQVDGLAPEYYDPSRNAEFEYSAEFPGGPLVLYKRRDDPVRFIVDPVEKQEQALRLLQSRRFGVVRGYLNTPVFDAADYLTKQASNDDSANLRLLVFGRIDLAVIDRRVAEYLIRTQHPEYAERIEPMDPPLADKPLFIAFSRKSPRMREALDAFNEGLAALQAEGTVERLYARHVLHAARD